MAALAALLPLAFAMPVQAATDQMGESFLPPLWPGFQGASFMAQTFTPKANGQVDRVSLPLYTPTGFGMVGVSLNTVDATGAPTSTALGNAPLFIGFLAPGRFTDFWFTQAVPVTAGTKYAIVAHLVVGSIRWPDGGAFPYSGGQQWVIQTTAGWQTTSHPAFVFEEWVLSGSPTNLAPTVTSDQSLVSVPEGTTAKNTGTCSDTDGDTLTMSATGGGAVSQCTGGHWSWSMPTADDAPAKTITVTANDGHGNAKSTSFQLNVTNVAPTATISWTDPLVLTTLETLTFHAAVTDVDSNDTMTTKWDFGDGSTATGTDASHAYATAGTYTITFTVSDGEGGSATATTTLTVMTTKQALTAIETYVQGLKGLNDGQMHSLLTKLSNAADDAARGDNNAAAGQLNAFLNELQAYVDSGKVSPTAGAALRTAVNSVRASLGTFNRLVDWWPLEA